MVRPPGVALSLTLAPTGANMRLTPSQLLLCRLRLILSSNDLTLRVVQTRSRHS